jgi:hypothetical protein
MEETQRHDPFEEGAAPWTEKATRIAREWAAGRLERRGVSIVRVIEYVMLDAINRRYAEAQNG